MQENNKNIKNLDLKPFISDRSRGTNSYASITKNHTLFFSSLFVKKNEKLFKNQYCTLFFSKPSNCMVIRFTNNEKEPGVFKINNKQKTFSIRSFLRYFELDLKQVIGKYNPVEKYFPELGNCLLIDFNEKVI